MIPRALLLAAGSSVRFGKQNKLLADIQGEPLIRRAFLRLRQAGIENITVVLGPDEMEIINALQGCKFQSIRNPKHQEGMGTSISCGVAGLPPSTEGVLIVPGDMPEILPNIITEIIEVFKDYKGFKIICPRTPDGQQRNPVMWPKSFFSQLVALNGSIGGKNLVAQYPDSVAYVPVTEASPFIDIDTQEDIEDYQDRIYPHKDKSE